MSHLTVLFDEDRGNIRELFVVLNQINAVFQKLAWILFDVHIISLCRFLPDRLVVGVYSRVDHLHELIRVH